MGYSKTMGNYDLPIGMKKIKRFFDTNADPWNTNLDPILNFPLNHYEEICLTPIFNFLYER